MRDKSDKFASSYGEVGAARKAEFLNVGYKSHHFFPHHVYHLPKCGPDGFKLAHFMCTEQDPNRQSELVLYTTPEVAAEFPDDLWFDNELVWHQQQFGRPGQVATANLRQDSGDLYSMGHISDLVQRISRRPADKSRIEKRFKGWPAMLLNAIVAYAAENGFGRVFVPKSKWAMKHTDPKPTVQAALFERVYDRPVSRYFPQENEYWWIVDVFRSRDLIVFLEMQFKPLVANKTICICHDIERGLGHIDCDPEFARAANKKTPNYIYQMAEIENSLGIRSTYNVVGCLFSEVRPVVEELGHEVAFHSYNHIISEEQLAACRSVDYRIEGYRPPQSRITPELTDTSLCHHNFEWFASSAHSLGYTMPVLENRLVKIPILFDDFTMYSKGISFEEWQRSALEKIKLSRFVAFSLHDCYAGFWLPDYHSFLAKISKLGVMRTLSEVAASLFFQNSGSPLQVSNTLVQQQER